jgi:AraC-like DNA-binding protein
MTPINLLLEKKIKCAKQLLSAIQINEVCHLSGFEDSNYFIRLFKKARGIAPIPIVIH